MQLLDRSNFLLEIGNFFVVNDEVVQRVGGMKVFTKFCKTSNRTAQGLHELNKNHEEETHLNWKIISAEFFTFGQNRRVENMSEYGSMGSARQTYDSHVLVQHLVSFSLVPNVSSAALKKKLSMPIRLLRILRTSFTSRSSSVIQSGNVVALVKKSCEYAIKPVSIHALEGFVKQRKMQTWV